MPPLTTDEFKALIEKSNQGTKTKRRKNNEEAMLQKACVRWFRCQYPTLAPLLFAVPNGGFRNEIEAKELARQGVVSGVADLILLKPSKDRQFSALCLELKAKTGKQSLNQISWEKHAKSHGNRYVLVKTIEEFMRFVTEHLKN